MTFGECRMSSGWLTMLSYVIRMTYETSLSHPDELAIGSISSGWLMPNVLCHPDDITEFRVSHPDDFWWMQDVIRMTYDVVLCHPDDIRNFTKSSGWVSYWQYLIRMTYAQCIMSSGWHNVFWTLKSSGWVSYCQYLIRMTYVRCSMSSGWLTILLYVIRMR